jgi:deoxyuridine 5'-triphosphate nucleotidohydrolase
MDKKMIDITLTRKTKFPERGTPQSAGIDIFIPEFDFSFRKDFSQLNLRTGSKVGTQQIAIPAHCGVLIPSGIRYMIPNNHALIAMNKSSIASKTGLIVGACVNDADYQGEYIISLINTTDLPVKIDSGQKIVQLVLVSTPVVDFRMLPLDDFNKIQIETVRASGGFGSTGK